MRLYMLFIALFLHAGAAFAEEAKSPVTIKEYENVPPGILMTYDAETEAPKEDKQGEILTMENLVAAYTRGEYDLVIKHLVPIANSNYAQAQEMLGVMYRHGHGVKKDPKAAVEWLTKAAEAGRPLAQHHLAIMSFTGEGMPQDSVRALMWLYISIAHYPDGAEKDRAKQDRNNILSRLSRRDKGRALDLARDWLEKRDQGSLIEQVEMN
jgi:TPR repeat protein